MCCAGVWLLLSVWAPVVAVVAVLMTGCLAVKGMGCGSCTGCCCGSLLWLHTCGYVAVGCSCEAVVAVVAVGCGCMAVWLCGCVAVDVMVAVVAMFVASSLSCDVAGW